MLFVLPSHLFKIYLKLISSYYKKFGVFLLMRWYIVCFLLSETQESYGNFLVACSHRPIEVHNIYNQVQVKLLMDSDYANVPDYDAIFRDDVRLYSFVCILSEEMYFRCLYSIYSTCNCVFTRALSVVIPSI